VVAIAQSPFLSQSILTNDQEEGRMEKAIFACSQS